MHRVHQSRFARVRWLLLALSIALIVAVPSAQAQEGGNEKNIHPVPDKTFSRVIDQRGLVRQASDNGQMRVIINLQSAFVPEGQLVAPNETVQSSAAVRVQRQALNFIKNETLNTLQSFQGFQLVYQLKNLPHLVAIVDAQSLAAITRLPRVVSVDEDILMAPELAHSTGYIGASGPGGAWELGLDGAGFAVVILDTGVLYNHTFMSGEVAFEACFSDPQNPDETTACQSGRTRDYGGVGTSSPFNVCIGYSNGADTIDSDQCAHGLHVSGIAAGRLDTYTDPSIAEAGDTATQGGVAHNADIISIQIGTMFDSASDCGSRGAPCILSYTSTIVDAMNYVYNNLASVSSAGPFNVAAINYSFGGSSYTTFCDSQSASLVSIINSLRSVGIAFVSSSGNAGNTNSITFPACIQNTIAVGSVDINHAIGTLRPHPVFPGEVTENWPDTANYPTYYGSGVEQISEFSNIGIQIDLLAPGQKIQSSIPGASPGDTTTFDLFLGTSMAAPHVTGAWAIMKQQSPIASVNRILATLDAAGVEITDSTYLGNSVNGNLVFPNIFRSGAGGGSYPRIDVAEAIRFYGSDFGDAPVSYNPAGDVAEHLIVPEYYLGSAVSAETTDAMLDRDDDGVQIPVLARGATADLGLTASVTYANGMPEDYLGRLNAWVDFNADGDFEDVGEQIAHDLLMTGPYPQTLPVEIPVDAAPGETYARFRYSTERGIRPTGLAYNGEVEDYVVRIIESDEVVAAVLND